MDIAGVPSSFNYLAYIPALCRVSEEAQHIQEPERIVK